MPTEEIAAFAVLGLVIGWLLGWALGRSGTRVEKQRADGMASELARCNQTTSELRTERDAARSQLVTLTEQDKKQSAEISRLTAERNNSEQNARTAASDLVGERTKNNSLTGELSKVKSDLAALRKQLEGDQKGYEEKLALLTSARVELSNQFKAVAGDILKENSQAFTAQNQTNIGELLKPVKDKFADFQEEVKKLNDSSIAGRTKLETQIENLAKLNTRLSDEASNLTTALKGSSKTQGNWGEQLLETILESAGLHKGHEYLTQESFLREERAEDGRLRAQLDVLVRMPENRNIIIDSKVSLNAYNDYCAAPDDATREAALKKHIESARTHILGLSKRNYQLLDGINSPDFVVMFVPIEPAFMLAISADSKLWQDAWNKNVLLVSPSTLLFVLRTVAQLWRQELQSKNIKEIVKRGGDLYEKLVGFAKDLVDVGESLNKARGSYDEAVKKLSTGRGNVIRQAEMLKKLGVKSSKKLPLTLVNEDEPLTLAAASELEPSSESDTDSLSPAAE